MLVFASFGVAIGTLAGSMPSVLRAAHVDSQSFGLGLTLSTFATVAAMSMGGVVARKASNRAVLLLALPLLATFLFAFLTSQSPVWFFPAIIAMGTLFGLLDLFMNAEATAIEHDMRRPVFTAFHGAASAAVAISAILSSFASVEYGPWAAALGSCLSFGLAWLTVWRAVPARPLASGRAARIMALPNKTPLVLLGVSAGLIIAGETAALLWSAKLLDEIAPSLAAIAGLGAAFFGLCNAAVRFPGDSLRARFGDLPLMIGSLLIAIAGFAVMGLSGNFAMNVAAFAAVGLGTAVLVPCIFAVAARFVPANRAGGLGFVSLISGLPRALAPWAFGLVAANFGIDRAFSLLAVAMVVALALVVVLMRSRDG
ncbi:MAG: MFS transporter [Alphaproteobacteria bacterium]|nr:MFS transporter [Alphaproteobacteria bacterium]